MECWEQIVQSLQTQTGHTNFKQRIKLELLRIFLPLKCTELLVDLEVSMSIKGLLYLSLIIFLMVSLLCLLGTGTRLATRYLYIFIIKKIRINYFNILHIHNFLYSCILTIEIYKKIKEIIIVNLNFKSFKIYCLIWQKLQQILDSGKSLPFPDGILINGLHKAATFIGKKG